MRPIPDSNSSSSSRKNKPSKHNSPKNEMDAQLQKVLETEGEAGSAEVSALVDKIIAAHDPALFMRAVELRLLPLRMMHPKQSTLTQATAVRFKQCAATR